MKKNNLMRRLILCASIACIAVNMMLTGCSLGMENGYPTDDLIGFDSIIIPSPIFERDTATEAIYTAAESINLNSFNVLNALIDGNGEENENIIFSPASLNIVLSILYSGADGNTADRLQTFIMGDNTSDIIGIYSSYLDNLKSAGDYDKVNVEIEGGLKTDSSLWAGEAISLQSDFMESTQFKYGADIFENIDFKSSEAQDKVNEWINSGTNGRFPDGFNTKDIRNDSALILNTVYFKDYWIDGELSQFPNETFYVASGEVKNVDMLGGYEGAYYEDNKYEAFTVSMRNSYFTVIMPKSISEKTKIDLEYFDGIREKWKPASLTYKFPALKMNKITNIAQALNELGMTDIFDAEKASFSNMSKDKLFINQISQQCFIDVNKNGVEAGALTATSLDGALLNEEEKIIIVDRPFYFVLNCRLTGSILFMGYVTDPTL